ncbi:nucleotidyltransferase family protein [Paenibacillus silvae]|uniref:nucleotidyltransferase family protein n=1 Tax=Paenibacillus silvae TaxID=1325358 RepID=UPI0011A66A77|nr:MULTISPECIES: nucleotidyltransferase family protein [Paenibacillus]MCK6075214.1 nucleotidyltransferase family protein [Paenibacillus silvae]MCK6149601.1 nucleotidyltransferase family protein [Paenibacillus silvae]MCK6267899.1 nucleotidyltransferase family protein [Paenibacillus silvae]
MEEMSLLKKIMRSVAHKDNMAMDSKEDIDTMLGTISKHKLEPYVNVMQGNSLPEIENRLTRIKEQYKRHITFLEKLRNTTEKPIVVVKGFSNYHASEGRVLLRETSDLDILSPHPVRLREELLASGFIEKKTETEHELSELEQDGILIDIHKFVPVASYPADIEEICESNHYTTTEGMFFSGEISYNDIKEHSIEIIDNVLVPNVNMSLLISCVSMFRDYITSLEDVPNLKLINLVEIFILMHEPTFDPAEFIQMVRKYKAEHSIAFVNHLLLDIYDEQLVDVGDNIKRFPQILFWSEKWIIPLDVVKSVCNTRFENVLELLGAEQKWLDEHHSLRMTAASRSPRYHTFNDEFDKQITLAVKWTDHLHISLEMTPFDQLHDHDIFRFNFGKSWNKIFLFGSDEWGTSLFGETFNDYAGFVHKEGEQVLKIDILIPPEKLETYLLHKHQLGVNIYLEKHENNKQFSMYIPLFISKVSAGMKSIT